MHGLVSLAIKRQVGVRARGMSLYVLLNDLKVADEFNEIEATAILASDRDHVIMRVKMSVIPVPTPTKSVIAVHGVIPPMDDDFRFFDVRLFNHAHILSQGQFTDNWGLPKIVDLQFRSCMRNGLLTVEFESRAGPTVHYCSVTG